MGHRTWPVMAEKGNSKDTTRVYRFFIYIREKKNKLVMSYFVIDVRDVRNLCGYAPVVAPQAWISTILIKTIASL